MPSPLGEEADKRTFLAVAFLVVIDSFCLWWVYGHLDELRPPPCPPPILCFQLTPVVLACFSVVTVVTIGVLTLGAVRHPVAKWLLVANLPLLCLMAMLLFLRDQKVPLPISLDVEGFIVNVILVWVVVSDIVGWLVMYMQPKLFDVYERNKTK